MSNTKLVKKDEISKFKLTKEDKEQLESWGFKEEDFSQIEEAGRETIYLIDLNDSTEISISREQVLETMETKEFLSGIGRSAFHWSAVRYDKQGKAVYFDSSGLFR